MIRCSRCNIDKEADQYASYFHSKQNKIRTRKICISCFNHQKSIYRESIKNKKIIDSTPIEISSTPIPLPEFRKCSDCDEVKELNIDNFRKNAGERRYYSNRCIECQKHIDKIYAQTKRDEEKFNKPTPTPTPEPLVNPEVFIDMDIDTKECFTCKIEKPVTDFYIHKRTGKPFTSCKRCELDKDSNEYQDYIEQNGGSDKVRLRPGQWVDKYQQENVEGFLKVIGWKHNGKHWYKEGVRSGEDGVWEKMRGRPKYRKPIERKAPSFTDRLRNQVEDIIKLRDAGETLKVIAGIYSTSIPTLYKVIYEYYEKKEAR